LLNAADLLACPQFVLGLEGPTNKDLAHAELCRTGAAAGDSCLPDTIQPQKLFILLPGIQVSGGVWKTRTNPQIHGSNA